MGLCFGSGQLGLGAVAAVLGLAVLSGLNWAEDRLPRDRQAVLILTVASERLSEPEIRTRIDVAGYQAAPRGITFDAAARNSVLTYDVSWRSRRIDKTVPAFLQEFAADPAIVALNWREAEPA